MTVKEALFEGNVFISVRMDTLEDTEYEKSVRVEIGTEDLDDILAPSSLVYDDVKKLLQLLQIETDDRHMILSENFLTFYTNDFFDEVDMRLDIPASVAKIRDRIRDTTFKYYKDLFAPKEKLH
jgi:hypothetical protein